MSGSAETCPPGEISGRAAMLTWGVPILAIVAGSIWTGLFLWLATPAFAVMGGACAVNATRCGRLHCYVTGPLLLGMAGFLIAVAVGWAPAEWIDRAGYLVITGVVLAFAAEWISGRRYIGSRS